MCLCVCVSVCVRVCSHVRGMHVSSYTFMCVVATSYQQQKGIVLNERSCIYIYLFNYHLTKKQRSSEVVYITQHLHMNISAGSNKCVSLSGGRWWCQDEDVCVCQSLPCELLLHGCGSSGIRQATNLLSNCPITCNFENQPLQPVTQPFYFGQCYRICNTALCNCLVYHQDATEPCESHKDLCNQSCLSNWCVAG